MNYGDEVSPWQAYRQPDGAWRPPGREGLARVLAKAGYGARPRTEALLRDGRITVDGHVVRDPGHAVTPQSVLRLDGEVLREAVRHHLVMHKPTGVDCQPGGDNPRNVSRYLNGPLIGLEPAGRLAIRARGLLLLSNDLWWNAKVCQNNRLERGYEVLLGGRISQSELDVINAGILLPAFGHIKAEQVELIEEKQQGSLIRMSMRGGHDRQVRGVFMALHHEILRIVRVALGPVTLAGLENGRFRSLTPAEVVALSSSDD